MNLNLIKRPFQIIRNVAGSRMGLTDFQESCQSADELRMKLQKQEVNHVNKTSEFQPANFTKPWILKYLDRNYEMVFYPCHTLCLAHIEQISLPETYWSHLWIWFKTAELQYSYKTTANRLFMWGNHRELRKHDFAVLPILATTGVVNTDVHRHCRSFSIVAASVFMTEIWIPTCTMFSSQSHTHHSLAPTRCHCAQRISTGNFLHLVLVV